MGRLAALSDAVREFRGDVLTACRECVHYRASNGGYEECCTSGKFSETINVMTGTVSEIPSHYSPPCDWVSNGYCPHFEKRQG